MDEHTYRINKAVMTVNPEKDPVMNPKINRGLWPVIVQMRQELHWLNMIRQKERKEKMRKLIRQDIEKEDTELRKIGKAYLYTQL